MIWKKDKNGCSNLRKEQIDKLFENRNKLKGLREEKVKEYLGMPDQKDLQTRSQKMYKYWISGSPVCPQTGNQKRLVIRFNALNKANEVFIE